MLSSNASSVEQDPAANGETAPSDATLVRLATGCGRRSEQAYAALYRRHQAAVRATVSNQVWDASVREDIVQDTFCRAFARLSDLREADRLRPWLLQTARRLAIDHLRRRARRPDEVELVAEQPSVETPTEDLAELRDLADRLRGAMVKLPGRDALALTLAIDLGLSPAEMATALGVTENHAKVILHRARRRLRDAVGDIEREGER